MKHWVRTKTYNIILLASVLLLWSSTYICIKIGLGLENNSPESHHFFSAGPLALFRAIIASITLLLFNLRLKTVDHHKYSMLTRYDLSLIHI